MANLRFFLSIAITVFFIFCTGNIYASLCTNLGIGIIYQVKWALGLVIASGFLSFVGHTKLAFDFGPFNVPFFLAMSSVGSFPIFERALVKQAISAGVVAPGQILAILVISFIGCALSCSSVYSVLQEDFSLQ